MHKDSKYSLLIKASQTQDGIYQEILAKDVGWEFLNFNARILKKGQVWKGFTGENEFGIILLSGDYSVKTDQGNWKTKNGRKHVFDGIAHTLYLSRNTEFELTAQSEILDIALGWCETTEDHPVQFKKPTESAIEIRGGDNATRQINSMADSVGFLNWTG